MQKSIIKSQPDSTLCMESTKGLLNDIVKGRVSRDCRPFL